MRWLAGCAVVESIDRLRPRRRRELLAGLIVATPKPHTTTRNIYGINCAYKRQKRGYTFCAPHSHPLLPTAIAFVPYGWVCISSSSSSSGDIPTQLQTLTYDRPLPNWLGIINVSSPNNNRGCELQKGRRRQMDLHSKQSPSLGSPWALKASWSLIDI
jgi:hypothetical protein